MSFEICYFGFLVPIKTPMIGASVFSLAKWSHFAYLPFFQAIFQQLKPFRRFFRTAKFNISLKFPDVQWIWRVSRTNFISLFQPLGILAHLLRMVSWNLNTLMRMWLYTPCSSSDVRWARIPTKQDNHRFDGFGRPGLGIAIARCLKLRRYLGA